MTSLHFAMFDFVFVVVLFASPLRYTLLRLSKYYRKAPCMFTCLGLNSLHCILVGNVLSLR